MRWWCAITWTARASTCSSPKPSSIRWWRVVSAMAERARPAATLGCLTAGLALALLPTWLASRWALLGLLLAQPLLALAWGGWRGRAQGTPPTPWLQDALALLLLWGLSFSLTALLLAWPMLALLETGALVPALLLSLCSGFL